ncbi:MAG TPA: GyrI-like domain-containing protein [Roseiarcus sp.]
MSFGPIRFAVASFIAAAAMASPCGGFAQDNPATPPATQAPASGAPAAPAAAKPAEPPSTTPAPAAPEAAKPGEQSAPGGEASTGETVDMPARPFAYIEGKADRDEIYSAILGSLGLVRRDMEKASLAPSGRPIAVFVESDDTGFKYHAGYPLASTPEGKTSLSDAVKIGEAPSGKAMRFEHQGAYSDIDATYDAITAYLDEKGIDAQDSFVEEYANDVKDPDDPTLQVNIYVLLK